MANGLITKVQSVSITIPTGAASATATIVSVNTALSAVFYNGSTTNNTASNSATNDFTSVALTNSTTVTAFRGASSASFTVTVKATVVTFVASAINNIQQGSITLGTSQTSNTATIASINTANSFCMCNGFIVTTGVGNNGSMLSAVALTNGTTVTASKAFGGGGATTVYYTVISFASGVLNSSTQSVTITISSGTSNTASISAVTPSQSMVVWGGTTTTDSTFTTLGDSLYLSLTSGSVVTATANGTLNATSTSYFTVVEFKAANMNSVNRGTITIGSSATSNTATVTSVNSAYSIPNFTGFSSEFGSLNENGSSAFSSLALTNPTTLTAVRNTSAASTVNQGWELIEFMPYTPGGNMILCF